MPPAHRVSGPVWGTCPWNEPPPHHLGCGEPEFNLRVHLHAAVHVCAYVCKRPHAAARRQLKWQEQTATEEPQSTVPGSSTCVLAPGVWEPMAPPASFPSGHSSQHGSPAPGLSMSPGCTWCPKANAQDLEDTPGKGVGRPCGASLGLLLACGSSRSVKALCRRHVLTSGGQPAQLHVSETTLDRPREPHRRQAGISEQGEQVRPPGGGRGAREPLKPFR